MRAALYFRVSTDKQEADNQRMLLRHLYDVQAGRWCVSTRITTLGDAQTARSSGRC